MDAVPRHLAPQLPFRHRHLNNSERLESADQVISFPQLSHSNLRRIKPTSFMNSMASAISVKRDVRKVRLGAPSKHSNGRWYVVDSNRTKCTQEKHRQSARTVQVKCTQPLEQETHKAREQYPGSALNCWCRVEVGVSRRTMGVSYSNPCFFHTLIHGFIGRV
jgi:hypothetical protein